MISLINSETVCWKVNHSECQDAGMVLLHTEPSNLPYVDGLVPGKGHRKAIIDDGCSPELLEGAILEGKFQMPKILPPKQISIPSAMIPFSFRHRKNEEDEILDFYEMDYKFSDVLINPKPFIEEFKCFKYVLTLDCSLYRDMPLIAQLINIYRNRSIGHYFQHNGYTVIPQVRWGNEYTYTTKFFQERVAFLGVAKKSIVAVSNYGCFNTKEDRKYFYDGLEAMFEALEPKIVLLHGSYDKTAWAMYEQSAQIVPYMDWISRVRRKQ